jgi:hypothetical protein
MITREKYDYLLYGYLLKDTSIGIFCHLEFKQIKFLKQKPCHKAEAP